MFLENLHLQSAFTVMEVRMMIPAGRHLKKNLESFVCGNLVEPSDSIFLFLYCLSFHFLAHSLENLLLTQTRTHSCTLSLSTTTTTGTSSSSSSSPKSTLTADSVNTYGDDDDDDDNSFDDDDNDW